MPSDFVMTLPAVNAALNGAALVLLLAAYTMIRRRRVRAHRRLMLMAFSTSVLFLISYVTYHAMRGGVSTPFGGVGAIRPIYFVMLISHIVLAATVPVLAIIALRLGLKGEYVRHRRIARWTFPIWVYVSITGVLVYFMLYQWYPGPVR